ncbi:MAG: lipoyl synthase [Verrucomicrobia bacterium]|nr:lipoyl synthase [Verrucomicrobiota bacterium]MCG2678680.1 lipoyl synthase [Kiritimatiellia bacterium]MBU4248501.1 lipoyl synthase [Verrucomicrobiota bacterium]MBU4291313.1 lipoyl synthase [Verrucomicrobiota bacterium]MBU4429179.1 lipoyl synthase [Verrucomicrobiota bacterium]
MKRLPPWIRIRLKTDGHYAAVQNALETSSLHTVCENAQCPNKQECFNRGTAAMMILGNLCTRQCRFCAVRGGTPLSVDPDEPARVANLAARLGIRHVVVTSVTRDDLPDGGAAVYAETITRLKALPAVTVEVLIPDFQGDIQAINRVLSAGPDVFNHNLETVARLQPAIRPQADFHRSLSVLRTASAYSAGVKPTLRAQLQSAAMKAGPASPHPLVKSGLMVGLGETDDELFEALDDLRAVGCEALTLGQYLAPSRRHVPVDRFVPPDQFARYRERALAMGFTAVAAGPLVRSSYNAETLFREKNTGMIT